MSRRSREKIFELREKVNFLQSHEVPCRRCRVEPGDTVNALAVMLKRNGLEIALSDLQKALRQSDDNPDGIEPGDERLGRGHQQRLAAFFGFEIGWPHNKNGWREWCDPEIAEDVSDSERHDTAEKFIARYCREHRQPDPGAVVMLMEGPAHVPERTPELASVEIEAGQIGEGTADLGVYISCGFASVQQSRFLRTLRAARMQIGFSEEGRARRDTIKGRTEPQFELQGTYGPVRARYGAGTTRQLDWRLDATGVSLGNIDMDIGFVALERLSDGETVTASIGTWLKDIEPVDEQSDTVAGSGEIAIVDSEGQEVEIAVNELTTEQRRFIEHLELAGLERDEQNFAVLASHELTFVRRRP
ncbi:MAG: hypothetical protein AAF732_20950 [Pseudomonadota bacterium]